MSRVGRRWVSVPAICRRCVLVGGRILHVPCCAPCFGVRPSMGVCWCSNIGGVWLLWLVLGCWGVPGFCFGIPLFTYSRPLRVWNRCSGGVLEYPEYFDGGTIIGSTRVRGHILFRMCPRMCGVCEIVGALKGRGLFRLLDRPFEYCAGADHIGCRDFHPDRPIVCGWYTVAGCYCAGFTWQHVPYRVEVDAVVVC